MSGLSASDVSAMPTELGLETDGGAVRSPDPVALAPGDLVGRFVILSRLGAGGMGVVYAAHDPELDRKVALKLLRPGLGGNPVGRARLLREAQALARLSHPNVVAVHDVGTHAGQVWLAMEFIEGQTLGAWLAADVDADGGSPVRPTRPAAGGRSRTELAVLQSSRGRRRPAEILAVLVQAARGVMAAHAAGLLHRDLKPDNVMVGRGGRVWVMDFGLARSQLDGSVDAPSSEGSPDAHATGSMASNLTEVGALVGTPAYMAPEQFLGGPVDARTDQFSLCVTLWEALYGERPFAGENAHALCLAITGGQRRPVPRGARVPGWLRRACERGLAVDPGARFPSMEALLRALEDGRARARWRVGAAVGLLALAGAGVSLAWQQHQERQRIAACEADGAGIEAVWGPPARDGLSTAFEAIDAKVGPETAERVEQWLDRYASEWSEARTQACLDADVHGTWSADTLARAQWCLDERRSQLEALVGALSTADARVLSDAVEAAWSLPALAPCRDEVGLERLPFPSSDLRAQVEAIRTQQSRAGAQYAAGHYDDALSIARDALAQAEALGWPPLTASIRELLGGVLVGKGEYAEAEVALEEAYFEASRAGADATAADAAGSLVTVVGIHGGRSAEGLRWSRLAELALLELGREVEPMEASLLHSTASLHAFTGQHAKARPMFERALAMRQQALGDDHPALDDLYTNLAIVHVELGDRARAKAMFERVVELRTQALGPTHPKVAAALNNLGSVQRDLGEYAAAKVTQERALAIKEERLGPGHPEVGTSLMNLALVHDGLGDRTTARTLAERALAIHERAFGPDHPAVANVLITAALILEKLGELDEARARLERALAIHERTFGPSHPSVAQVLNNFGAVLIKSGDVAAGEAMLERTVAIVESALGVEHPHLGYPLAMLAKTALEHDRAAQALAWAERALKVRGQAGVPAEQLAEARVLVAQALVATGGDRERAVWLARQAHTSLRELGVPGAEGLAKVEAWMKMHGIAIEPP